MDETPWTKGTAQEKIAALQLFVPRDPKPGHWGADLSVALLEAFDAHEAASVVEGERRIAVAEKERDEAREKEAKSRGICEAAWSVLIDAVDPGQVAETLAEACGMAVRDRDAARAEAGRLRGALLLVEWSGAPEEVTTGDEDIREPPMLTCPRCGEGHPDDDQGGGHSLLCEVRAALSPAAEPTPAARTEGRCVSTWDTATCDVIAAHERTHRGTGTDGRSRTWLTEHDDQHRAPTPPTVEESLLISDVRRVVREELRRATTSHPLPAKGEAPCRVCEEAPGWKMIRVEDGPRVDRAIPLLALAVQFLANGHPARSRQIAAEILRLYDGDATPTKENPRG
jgi:hypothetical protein